MSEENIPDGRDGRPNLTAHVSFPSEADTTKVGGIRDDYPHSESKPPAMSEADTIREALERGAGLTDSGWWGDALEALTALERRAEQEVIRAEHAEAGLSLLNADRERAERRAEQAERARDEAVELPDRDALRARAEQAEAALREIARVTDRATIDATGYGPSWSDIHRRALAATTPGEPQTALRNTIPSTIRSNEPNENADPATTPGEPEGSKP